MFQSNATVDPSSCLNASAYKARYRGFHGPPCELGPLEALGGNPDGRSVEAVTAS